MCARYNIKTDIRDVVRNLKATLVESAADQLQLPNFNVAPTQVVPAITLNGERKVRALRWGLLPVWARDPRMGSRMINARSETIADKPAFRNAFKSRRCLIPASGFYEWTGEKSPKQPWLIQRADSDLLVMAGLWETHREFGETFTIVTCEPSTWMTRYHNRMPVVLEAKGWDVWLDPASDPGGLHSLMVPAGEDVLAAYPVSKDVNNPRNNRPDLIEAVPLNATLDA